MRLRPRLPLDDDPTGHGVDVDGIVAIAPGTAGGPGIGIEEAISNGGAEALLVNGALVADPDGRVLLCDALAESFPPQCGGARLEVRGLDVDALDDVQEGNGVRGWSRSQLSARCASSCDPIAGAVNARQPSRVRDAHRPRPSATSHPQPIRWPLPPDAVASPARRISVCRLCPGTPPTPMTRTVMLDLVAGALAGRRRT